MRGFKTFEHCPNYFFAGVLEYKVKNENVIIKENKRVAIWYGYEDKRWYSTNKINCIFNTINLNSNKNLTKLIEDLQTNIKTIEMKIEKIEGGERTKKKKNLKRTRNLKSKRSLRNIRNKRNKRNKRNLRSKRNRRN